MTPSLQPPRPGARHGWAIALAAALLLAAVVRLVPWSHVFTGGGVTFLADGDTYYHALRARELAVRGSVSWRDTWLNYPLGAEVPWPPLFDAILAAPAWILHAGHPMNADVERSAAFVPVALGVLCVLLGALLATELLGEREGAIAAFLLAVLPLQSQYGLVGRTDQHVLEAALVTAMVWVFARAIRIPRRPPWASALTLGLLLCAAFWTWLGSALHVALLCAFAGAAHVFARDPDGGAGAPVRLVGLAMGAAAGFMSLSVAWLGPAGALQRVDLGGISAFPILLFVGGAIWCGLLAAAARRFPTAGPLRRALEIVAAAAVVTTSLILLSPGTRQAVSRGLLAVGRGNSWYASIAEFRPILLAPNVRVPDQLREALSRFGLVPILAVAGLHRLWVERPLPARRPQVLMLTVLALLFTALAAYMYRFAYYAALPLALFGAMGFEVLRQVATRVAGPRAGWFAGVAALLVSLAPTVSALTPDALDVPRFHAIASVLAPFRAGVLTGSGAIMARWDSGHHVRYLAERPIIASPFGTEGGVRAMEDTSAFFLADTPADAARLLGRRGVRWVLVEDPANAVLEALALTPKTPAPAVVMGGPFEGYRIHCEPSYDDLVAVRLYYEAGSASPRAPEAIDFLRVVNDVGAPGRPPATRLAEVVEGALLAVSGAHPGGEILAQTIVATPVTTFAWTTRAVADGAGRAVMRVPYATGSNGLVAAAAYRVWDADSRPTSVTVTERQVLEGAPVRVALGEGERPAVSH